MLQGEKVLAMNEGFSGSCRQPSLLLRRQPGVKQTVQSTEGEVGRNWVFGKIVHLLPIPLDFSVL